VLSLPDTLQISMGIGSLLGGFAGSLWEAHTGRAIVDNVVVGTTLGGFIGGMFGVAVWVAEYLDHGY
jgi:phage tail tape-measure protein